MINFIELILQKISEVFSKENLEFLPKKIAVAVSGGSDSMALTFILQEFCKINKIELVAITVNHKMRQVSDSEALELSKALIKKKITHHILEIKWQKKPQSNIELKLREERYKLLNQFCIKHEIKYLFLGHQIDDVAENFLIRLFRGSGLDGLSTIAEVIEFNKIKLIRPLLSTNKEDLQKFLKLKKIKWFEDETNKDENFLRNKIRIFLNSLPEANLIKKRVKNSTDEISKMRDLFDFEMLDKAKEMLDFNGNCFILDLEKFKKIDEKIGLKILALIAMELSNNEYKPRFEKLKIFYNWILSNQNHKPRDFYGCVAKRHKQKLGQRVSCDLAILLTKKDYNENDPKFSCKTILRKIFTI